MIFFFQKIDGPLFLMLNVHFWWLARSYCIFCRWKILEFYWFETNSNKQLAFRMVYSHFSDTWIFWFLLRYKILLSGLLLIHISCRLKQEYSKRMNYDSLIWTEYGTIVRPFLLKNLPSLFKWLKSVQSKYNIKINERRF